MALSNSFCFLGSLHRPFIKSIVFLTNTVRLDFIWILECIVNIVRNY